MIKDLMESNYHHPNKIEDRECNIEGWQCLEEFNWAFINLEKNFAKEKKWRGLQQIEKIKK